MHNHPDASLPDLVPSWFAARGLGEVRPPIPGGMLGHPDPEKTKLAWKMNDPTFETEIRAVPEIDDASMLLVRGRIRYTQAHSLRKAILDWVTRSTASRLIIELEEVEEMDTSGVAVLVESLVVGRDRSKQILLCSPSESVMRLFRLAGFEEALKACCPSPAEALQRLRA